MRTAKPAREGKEVILLKLTMWIDGKNLDYRVTAYKAEDRENTFRLVAEKIIVNKIDGKNRMLDSDFTGMRHATILKKDELNCPGSRVDALSAHARIWCMEDEIDVAKETLTVYLEKAISAEVVRIQALEVKTKNYEEILNKQKNNI